MNLDTPPENFPACTVHSLEHCFYMVAPRKLVDDYLHAGAYLVTPGWLVNWEAAIKAWGVDRDAAVPFFRGSVNKVVLLDTEAVPGSERHLQEFAAYAGLPAEHVKIGTDYLRLFFSEIVFRLQFENITGLARKERRLKADYAMILDFVLQLGDSFSEKETVRRLLGLLSMLCAPMRLCFMEFRDGKPGYTWPEEDLLPRERDVMNNAILHEDKSVIWDEDSGSLMVRLAYHGETVGVVYAQGLAFPEYKDQYMELARFIQNIAGLAISHARQFDRLVTLTDELHKEKEKLEAALEKVKQLRGLLPICASCKRIRTDEGYWTQLEEYFKEHADVEFSHGFCPDCIKVLYPEYSKRKIMDKDSEAGEE